MENKREFSPFRKIILLLIVSFVLLAFFSSIERYFNHDEFEAVHTAWKIAQGETIYVDFFQHHHPLLYYALIPIIKIFGASTDALIAARISVFFVFLISLVATYFLAKYVFDGKIALLSIFLLASHYFFVSKAIEVRPDLVQSAFGIFSIFFLFKYLREKKMFHLFLSAIFLAFSFLFLQKSIFLIFLVGLIILFNVYKKNIQFTDLLMYGAFFLIPIAPFLVYLAVAGNLETYYIFNWTLNAKFLNHFLPFEYLWENIYKNLLFWILFIIGCLFFSKTVQQKWLKLISLALLAFAFIIRSPFPQYYLIFIPYASIISASALYSIFRGREKIILTASVAAVIVPLFFIFNDMKNNNQKQLRKINYVLEMTDPDDYVYDGDIQFNIFRKDINFFWFSVRPKTGGLETYKTLRPYKYNIYEDIKTFQPKIISKLWLSTKNEVISQKYEKSPQYGDLYIRKD